MTVDETFEAASIERIIERTARSLLPKAGVSRDVSERILGHVVGTKIERTYDKHDYRAEKAHGLRALASLIDTIVNPAGDTKVVTLKGERRSTRQ